MSISPSGKRGGLFAELERINRRPEPFSCMTIRELWDDPHISEQMLRYHLDPTVDAASRSADFIDQAVQFMANRFGLTPGKRVVDLGCGPGLYAARLAQTGAEVTGVDFSARSIAYARRAAEAGVSARYEQANYLEWVPDHRYDLVLMIYHDYSAMAPEQRRLLLERVRLMLEPGGAFLFDAPSMAALADLEEAVAYAPMLMDGFWSPEPYYGFLNTFVYPDEGISVDRYEIIEADRTRTFCNWLQHFEPDSIADELDAGGFEVEEILGDASGSAFETAAHEFAVVARLQAAGGPR